MIFEIAPAMPDTALHFSNLSFAFDRSPTMFDGLNCSFENRGGGGKLIALMGPSGVGKSTFCELALGNLKPQNGSVRYEPEHANLAVIPQRAVVFEELSVEENIACLRYSDTLGSTFQESRVATAAASLGLSTLLQGAGGTASLSGGEAQRVMLARIQTVDCQLLILDEPCSFLDNRMKDSFLSALRKAIDELGLLSLMVTHVWDEVRIIADEVVFFHHVPGQALSLHRCGVEQAQLRPPTLDALYAIHWPRVELDEYQADGSPAPDWIAQAPSNCRYRAAFPAAEDTDGADRTCIYYDAHGLLINEVN